MCHSKSQTRSVIANYRTCRDEIRKIFQVVFAHGKKCTVVSGHCWVLLKDKKIELIRERLEFCLSLWLPIKRQDQNPLGQKTGELKQKKNTGLILPNI